ncbi:MAG: 23S rRNA (guanosine(2251)-2'-O)-methyltransferase RlmB, partial [Rikenellaceae bacterium]
DDDRGGFERRDDDRGGFKRRDDDRDGFKRRDDDRGGFKPRGDFKPKNDDKFRPKTDAGRAEQRAAERAERKVPENIIFGIHPIREALEAGGKLDKIYIIKEPNESLRTIESMALDLKIPVQNVPTVKLDKLSKNNNHQGVVATLAQVEYAELDEILAKEPTLLLVLDGVTDVRNFGAIARSAECAGVDAIIVGAKNGAQINGEAIKSSAGALLKIPVCRVGSLRLAVEAIKGQGIEPVAATEKSATPIYDVEMSSPVAIVMGAEDKGISSDILKLCDRRGAVPTTGTIESLNVSAAAAVILFEAVRQRL